MYLIEEIKDLQVLNLAETEDKWNDKTPQTQ